MLADRELPLPTGPVLRSHTQTAESPEHPTDQQRQKHSQPAQAQPVNDHSKDGPTMPPPNLPYLSVPTRMATPTPPPPTRSLSTPPATLPGSHPTTSPTQQNTFQPAGVNHDYAKMAEKAESMRKQVMDSRIRSMTTVQALIVTYPVAGLRGEGFA